MGPLMLPAGGPVYIDANAIIYSVERVEPYRRDGDGPRLWATRSTVLAHIRASP